MADGSTVRDNPQCALRYSTCCTVVLYDRGVLTYLTRGRTGGGRGNGPQRNAVKGARRVSNAIDLRERVKQVMAPVANVTVLVQGRIDPRPSVLERHRVPLWAVEASVRPPRTVPRSIPSPVYHPCHQGFASFPVGGGSLTLSRD